MRQRCVKQLCMKQRCMVELSTPNTSTNLPMRDRYDQQLSTTSPAAAHAYVRAADNLLAAGAQLMERFDEVIALDSGFAMAHMGRARCLATYGKGKEAQAAAQRARELSAGTSCREQSHIAALSLQINGQAAASLAAIREHLKQYPRDALALQPAAGIFGLIGFSGRMEREAEQLELLDELAPHYGNDWWFASAHAFAQCECGLLQQAEQRVEQSLAIAPHNANGAHIRTHVHYELGQAQAGAKYLREFLANYSTLGLLRGHLSWHLALWELGQGNVAQAWEIYEKEFSAPLYGGGAPTPPLNVLTDCVSWLWRAELAGNGAPSATSSDPHTSTATDGKHQDWSRLEQFALDCFPNAGIAFGDLHAALLYARTGNSLAWQRLQDGLDAIAAERPVFGATATLGRGFAAYVLGQWPQAADLLADAQLQSVMVGGSRAQRELIDRTLLAALRRSGRDQQARRVLAARPQIGGGV